MNALMILLLVSAVAATAVLTVPVLRRPLLTRHLLESFRKVVPRMSGTEWEALQAGRALAALRHRRAAPAASAKAGAR